MVTVCLAKSPRQGFAPDPTGRTLGRGIRLRSRRVVGAVAEAVLRRGDEEVVRQPVGGRRRPQRGMRVARRWICAR